MHYPIFKISYITCISSIIFSDSGSKKAGTKVFMASNVLFAYIQHGIAHRLMTQVTLIENLKKMAFASTQA